MEDKVEGAAGQTKNPIEALTREELIQKYKGLLGIAKKAKQAKDELAEDNRKLREALFQSETQKEADKKALLTMKETLEQFTEQKLTLTIEFSDLQKKSQIDEEALTNLRIENESLKRQLERLNEDNEALLKDIDRMEDQLKQVNILGMEQKKHLGLLELEVNKLKEAESLNSALQCTVTTAQEENKALKEQENSAKQALEELSKKYSRVKEINSEQRHKFNALKERFVEVHRKLKNLKECKRVLLETQHEYADAVSKWQNEIVKASRLLCGQMNALQIENEDLRQRMCIQRDLTETTNKSCLTKFDINALESKLQEMQKLCLRVRDELQERNALLATTQEQNLELEKKIAAIIVEEKRKELLPTKQDSDEVKRLTLELSELKAQLEVCNSRLKGGEADTLCAVLQPEHSELLERLNVLEIERNDLKQRCNITEDLQTDKKHLKNEVENLLSKLKESQQVHEDLQQIRDVLKTMEEEKIALLEQIRKQEFEQQNSVENIKTTEHNYAELQKRYAHLEREHADLLGEMRELNEALKARGDMISRQQEKQQELMQELRKTNTKLKQIDDILLQKDAAIAEKEAQVLQITREIDLTRQQTRNLEVASTRSEEQLRLLNEELQTLRTTTTTAADRDTQSDILSTSTISRAEEISRMRDIDDSFEDKYNKMRSLAIKLKKKLQDQTAQLSEMEQQQTGHVAMKAELDELRKQHKNLEVLNGEQQQQIETLKLENQKLKTSRKQANVLNLEIEAAEKSLIEATTKLATKTNELEKLYEQFTAKEHTIQQLRKEITIVESAKQSESTHAKELKEQVDILQQQLKDSVHAKQAAIERGKQLEETQERLKQELEQIRLEVSQCAAESSAALLSAQREKAEAEQRLVHTDAELRETKAKLNSITGSLTDLRAEYTEYKQKAQAVLRKHQNTDTTRERELTKELQQLRSTEEEQRQTINKQIKKLTNLEQHNADLALDNENLQRRLKELDSLIDDLRQQNEHLLHEQRTQMLAHQDALRAQRQQLEAVQECHKQQLMELETKYQQHIEQSKAMAAVRMPPIIGAASLQKNTNPTSKSSSTLMQAPPPPPLQLSEHEQSQANRMLLMLSEREDAEGSEEVTLANNNNTNTAGASGSSNNHPALRKISSGSSRRSQHDFMPLDELINTPMHAFQADTVVTTTSLSGNSFGRRRDSRSGIFELNAGGAGENLHVELHATRELLAKQESRVRHLTSLLAENEQDLAKLTQMNDMLKEELRRQERAVEREKHMHNAEYLKNVVLKFLTLSNGDERVRLVPVLNTILKLSRNETEMLNCVAKGQKLPTESPGRSWGSFIPIFGGGGGGSSN